MLIILLITSSCMTITVAYAFILLIMAIQGHYILVSYAKYHQYFMDLDCMKYMESG